jgi:hypothetical protein
VSNEAAHGARCACIGRHGKRAKDISMVMSKEFASPSASLAARSSAADRAELLDRSEYRNAFRQNINLSKAAWSARLKIPRSI